MTYKIGDRIRVTKASERFFQTGDVGRLLHCDKEGDWWADFSNQGNANVYRDGVWCIGDNSDRCDARYEPIEPDTIN